MAMPQTIAATRHAYANGEFKRMLIGGEWVKATSGKTFESRNPARDRRSAGYGRRG